MRNHLSTSPRYLCTAFLWVVFVTALAMVASALHAQCSDDNTDTLGCPIQPTPPAQAKESPTTFSITERALEDLPSADRSNEASANGSLAAGASYTEGRPSVKPDRTTARLQSQSRPTSFSALWLRRPARCWLSTEPASSVRSRHRLDLSTADPLREK